jgi:hypothetical protein
VQRSSVWRDDARPLPVGHDHAGADDPRSMPYALPDRTGTRFARPIASRLSSPDSRSRPRFGSIGRPSASLRPRGAASRSSRLILDLMRSPPRRNEREAEQLELEARTIS